MLGLFVLAIPAAPFKSKLRLQAENAVRRHQLNVLRRGPHGGTDDRIDPARVFGSRHRFGEAHPPPDFEILRSLQQRRQNSSIPQQGFASLSLVQRASFIRSRAVLG
jgi:hypothetical protein